MLNTDNNITRKPLTQCDMVLKFMQEKGRINPMSALSELGCFSLAARIYDLRKLGYQIIATRINKQGRYSMVNFSEYRLNTDGGVHE